MSRQVRIAVSSQSVGTRVLCSDAGEDTRSINSGFSCLELIFLGAGWSYRNANRPLQSWPQKFANGHQAPKESGARVIRVVLLFCLVLFGCNGTGIRVLILSPHPQSGRSRKAHTRL